MESCDWNRRGVVQGWTVDEVNPAPSRRRASQARPENARRGVRMDAHASADLYRDVLSADPDSAEKHRAFRFAWMRIGTPRWAPSLFGYFLGTAPQERRERRSRPRSGAGHGCPESCQEVTRSPAGRAKALASTKRKKRSRRWNGANSEAHRIAAEGTDARVIPK